MMDGHRNNSEYDREPGWSPGVIWSTLLVLAICGAVLVLSYFGPRPISPSFRATENPPALSGR